MEQGFIDILQKLIEEQGKEALLNAAKCEALLADYTKNEYKKESRLLLQALDAGVQKAIDTTKELAICKKQQVKMLHEDYGLDEKLAADIVDTLALVLRGDIAVTAPPDPSVIPLMKRGYLFLEDADWKQADEYFERVLDIDPEYAPAYIGKLCAELKVRQEDQLAQNKEPLAKYRHYQRAVQFADAIYRVILEQYDKAIKDRIDRIAEEKARIAKYQYRISVSYLFTVVVNVDDTVVAVGNNGGGQCDVSGWRGIAAVAAGAIHTVGLKTDGTVVAVGNNDAGQRNVSLWRGIVVVAAGFGHTVGLKTDGTVVAVGNNDYGQCDVSGWRGIVAVAANNHTVGLKTDGTVVAVGYNDYGQCDVSGWRGIVAVAAGLGHTVGIKTDGTVVAAGYNGDGQCDVSGWRGIVAVAAGLGHTVGIKTDGTVIAVGNNDYGQCDVSLWRGIVAVAAINHTVGLKTDGTVVAVGKNDVGQCNVSKEDMRRQQEQQQIEFEKKQKAERHREEQERREEQKRREREKEEQRKQLERLAWQQQGLCEYCGGQIGGIFTKKCKSCGKVN